MPLRNNMYENIAQCNTVYTVQNRPTVYRFLSLFLSEEKNLILSYYLISLKFKYQRRNLIREQMTWSLLTLQYLQTLQQHLIKNKTPKWRTLGKS